MITDEEKTTEKGVKQLVTAPEYNPQKQYTWDPEAKFELTGAQFGLWLNTVRGILSTPDAQLVQQALQCNEVIENLMVSGVSKGIIKEVVPKVPGPQK